MVEAISNAIAERTYSNGNLGACQSLVVLTMDAVTTYEGSLTRKANISALSALIL